VLLTSRGHRVTTRTSGSQNIARALDDLTLVNNTVASIGMPRLLDYY
jgi:hypothetical protein